MSKTLQVNGVRLVYDDAGSGIPFVTLHGGPGMGSRKGDWATFQPLTDAYRLISYDQRDNGESDGGEPYSHEQFVADLESLRQERCTWFSYFFDLITRVPVGQTLECCVWSELAGHSHSRLSLGPVGYYTHQKRPAPVACKRDPPAGRLSASLWARQPR